MRNLILNEQDCAPLTFAQLRINNVRRCEFWHSEGEPWDMEDWSNACGGEVGEARNIIKKIRRELSGTGGNADGVDMSTLRIDLANELADVFIYADLVAYYAGVSFPPAIYDYFAPAIWRYSRQLNTISTTLVYQSEIGFDSLLKIGDLTLLCDAAGLLESPQWQAQTIQGAGCSLGMAMGRVDEMCAAGYAKLPHLHMEFGNKIMDVILMCQHVAGFMDINLPMAVVNKFNEVSDRQNIDIYLFEDSRK